jgi:hypothetical protein
LDTSAADLGARTIIQPIRDFTIDRAVSFPARNYLGEITTWGCTRVLWLDKDFTCFLIIT